MTVKQQSIKHKNKSPSTTTTKVHQVKDDCQTKSNVNQMYNNEITHLLVSSIIIIDNSIIMIIQVYIN